MEPDEPAAAGHRKYGVVVDDLPRAETLNPGECVCESFGLERSNAKQMPVHLTWNVILQK